jgi:hypothetical protein
MQSFQITSILLRRFTLARYNWRKQESYFQPWRIKVAFTKRDLFDIYHVVKYNEVTGECLILGKDNSFSSSQNAVYTRREDAESKAKSIAIQKELPYIISRDYLSLRELERGRILRCVICEGVWKDGIGYARGRSKDACPDCRRAVNSWNTHVQESEQVTIYVDAIDLPVWASDLKTIAKNLLRFIVKVAAPNPKVIGALGDADIGTNFSSFEKRAYEVQLSSNQLSIIKMACEEAEALIGAAFNAGKREGSSILKKLASCQTSPEKFRSEVMLIGSNE